MSENESDTLVYFHTYRSMRFVAKEYVGFFNFEIATAQYVALKVKKDNYHGVPVHVLSLPSDTAWAAIHSCRYPEIGSLRGLLHPLQPP